MKNYYDILGLKNNATPDEIRTAFRKLSHKFHPDKNDGEEFFAEMFKQILEAYSTLIDSKKRLEYDTRLVNTSHERRAESHFRTQTATTRPSSPIRRTPAVTVWTSVEKWKDRRNAVALINVCLIVAAFLVSRTSSGNSTERDQEIQQSPAAHEVESFIPEMGIEEPANEVIPLDTFIDNTSQEENVPLVEPKSETVSDNSSAIEPSSVDSVEYPKEEVKSKKRGLLKRIFGKRNKDTKE